eukprot:gene17646-23990_t
MLGSSLKLRSRIPGTSSQVRGSSVRVRVSQGSYDSIDDQGCRLFFDRDGTTKIAMCADYGFRSGGGRLYEANYGQVPKNVFGLAKDSFQQELKQLRLAVRFGESINPAPREASTGLFAQVSSAVTGVARDIDTFLEEKNVFGKLELPPPKPKFLMVEWLEVCGA